MKVAYKHLISFIPSKPSIDEISDRFFQLGHEHEIEDKIFNMELTPNRGDCLSVYGLVRDLAPFYKIDLTSNIYEKELKKLDLGFVNHAPEACSHISFLKLEIEGEIASYSGKLKEYFKDLNINKNNFFTDISNYISYEMGQPTHCYDAEKLQDKKFSLVTRKLDQKFLTLLDKEVNLRGEHLVFVNSNNNVINLAGVMGGKDTSCSSNTKSVIIECAYFKPEYILGTSIKYDIKSDASHKFERGVDPLCHDRVLRRFIQIVQDHVSIKNLEIFEHNSSEHNQISLPLDVNRINKLLGISITEEFYKKSLIGLGFIINNNVIEIPSYRGDISTENDLAEEVARVIGYNNIPSSPIKILKNSKKSDENIVVKKLKSFLIEHGFCEVINNPFVAYKENDSISIDNPLDSSKRYLRTKLKDSLIENLLYNERRQNDSIKLFEISDVYYSSKINKKKMLGIICSGRVGKNYLNFSKKIDSDFLISIVKKLNINMDFNTQIINRGELDTKIKNEIIYLELEIERNSLLSSDLKYTVKEVNDYKFIKYKPISEFPSSTRDLSFSVRNKNKYDELQNLLLNFQHELIKETFIFDFFINPKNNDIKIGFRFIFQSKTSTIIDEDINEVMNKIIKSALLIDFVDLPGINSLK